MKIIISLFILGLSFGFGPCVASCGPVLVSYITGTQKNVRNGISVYLLFSASRIFVYLILGLIVFYLGQFAAQGLLKGISKYAVTAGGVFIIILGILTAYPRRQGFKLCSFLQRNLILRDKKSIILLGVVMGILPCAPLLALFAYIGIIAKNWPESLIYCFSFGLGTAISPLLVLSALAGLIQRLVGDRKEIPYRAINLVCGLIIVFIGIQLIMRRI